MRAFRSMFSWTLFATRNVIQHARLLFFNEDRIRNGAKKLTKARHSSTQGRLDNFFKVIPSTTSSAKRKVIAFWIFLMSDFVTFNKLFCNHIFPQIAGYLIHKRTMFVIISILLFFCSSSFYLHKNDYEPYMGIMGILLKIE